MACGAISTGTLSIEDPTEITEVFTFFKKGVPFFSEVIPGFRCYCYFFTSYPSVFSSDIVF